MSWLVDRVLTHRSSPGNLDVRFQAIYETLALTVIAFQGSQTNTRTEEGHKNQEEEAIHALINTL